MQGSRLLKLEKCVSLKELVLAGCRGGRVALSENTPLGYMYHKLFVVAGGTDDNFCSRMRSVVR
jgi:hypothetical protein